VLYLARGEWAHGTFTGDARTFAAALDVPLYRFFYTGEEPPPAPDMTPRQTPPEELARENDRAQSEAGFFLALKGLDGSNREADREVLLAVAKRLVAANQAR